MDVVIENVNTTAMILGYPVLAVIVFLIVWFGTRIFRDIGKIFNEMTYERWKRKNDERNESNTESSWMLELDEYFDEDEIALQQQNYDTDIFPRVPEQRHPTLELPQLYNVQEDNHEGFRTA